MHFLFSPFLTSSRTCPPECVVPTQGALVTRVQDVVTTGDEGHTFLKLDSGMTEVLRPSLYGAQHPICLVPKGDATGGESSYVIVGHRCESGDLVPPAPDEPEVLLLAGAS